MSDVPFTSLWSSTASAWATGPVAHVPTPEFPVWDMTASSQPPNVVHGISGPPGWQAPPPPGDPNVIALQSAALKSGLI